MTITYITKDITTVERGIIAHGCNAQGVMGSGVAKFLHNKYPQIFEWYGKLCGMYKSAGNEDKLLGEVDFVTINDNLIIANCFTQHLYGYNGTKFARPDAIRESLEAVMYVASEDHPPMPVYIPKIGAGRGGLDWETEVKPIIDELSTQYPDTPIYVCSWAE